MALAGCKKDLTLPTDGIDITQIGNTSSYLILRGGNQGGLRSEEVLEPTIVGPERNDPFTVTQMTQAWNTVYGTTYTALPETNRYVRFSPTSAEEYNAINATVDALFDFPLDRELIAVGDYYPQSGKGPEDWPDYYAVVSPDYQSPIAGYTVLKSLVILPTDSYVVAEAYRAAGLEYTIYRDMPDGTVEQYTTPGDCTPGSPGYPNCLTGNPGTMPLLMPCEPTSPAWPECAWPTPPPTDPDGGGDNLNECGCGKPLERRNPAGCIQVRNTVTGSWEGVRQVKVLFKDNLSQYMNDVTYTNDNGCFRINKKYGGRAWGWIKFENEKGKIRGVTNSFLYQISAWAETVTDPLGSKWGPVFNNYLIRYDMWQAPGTKAQLYFGAATTNNALHEFHDMASGLGIAPPPYLDIFARYGQTGGYALMKHYLGGAFPQNILGFINIITQPFLPFIGIGIMHYLPDVNIGIGQQQNANTSRELKELCYHEFAHASHFTKAGANFWNNMINATVLANGWGNQNSVGAGHLAISESWAEHIEHLMSANTFGDPDRLTITLERTRNFNANHVPIGLHWDLMDDVADTVNACDQETNQCGPIDDHVSDLTTSQLFNLLTGDCNAMELYRAKIKTLPGMNVTQVDNLVNSYTDTQ